MYFLFCFCFCCQHEAIDVGGGESGSGGRRTDLLHVGQNFDRFNH